MGSEVRNKLLSAFTDHKEAFVSGQQLSELLGCSRTAIWKHIEELRKDGFEIEAVQRKGYRMVHKPDRISHNEIQIGLQTKTLGRTVVYQESVATTQQIAHQLAHDGAAEGAIVVAEEQVQGRGRLNRNWFSPKFTGIWMSLILRPTIPPQNAPQLTLLTAVSVVRGIKQATGLSPDIKWPNDILINGKKIVGILTELQAEVERVNAVIIGIGINVNQTDFPEEIRSIASSLSLETGKKLDRASLIQAILLEMEVLYHDYLLHGFSVVKGLWESHAISIGKQITARTLTSVIKGEAIGITNDGVLLINDHEGKIHQIYSADIEIDNEK